MSEVRSPDHGSTPLLELRYERKSRHLAAGVDLELDRLHVPGGSILEYDRERLQPVDGGASIRQKILCSRRTAGHERLQRITKHENSRRFRPQVGA
jgi:hypothetical protein